MEKRYPRMLHAIIYFLRALSIASMVLVLSSCVSSKESMPEAVSEIVQSDSALTLCIIVQDEADARPTYQFFDKAWLQDSFEGYIWSRVDNPDIESKYTLRASTENDAVEVFSDIPYMRVIGKDDSWYLLSRKDSEEITLYADLRSLYDKEDTSAENLTVKWNGETFQEIAQQWVTAYREKLLNAAPGGARGLKDFVILRTEVTQTQEAANDEFIFRYTAAVKPTDTLSYGYWIAGNGEEMSGKMEGYIETGNDVHLAFKNSLWRVIDRGTGGIFID